MSESTAQVSDRSPADTARVAVGKAKVLGPYSADKLRRLDYRTHLGKHIRRFERMLLEHASAAGGGTISEPMRALVDQAVDIELSLKLLLSKGVKKPHDRNALSTLLGGKLRVLRCIGLDPPTPRGPSLHEYLAEKGAAAADPPGAV